MTSRNEKCSSSDSDERSVLTPETGSLPAPCNDLSITPGTPELKWYVVQSKPREEERALHFLKEKGFQTYLPRMEVVKVRKFKNVKSKQALFPGYLFCRFDKDENLGHVRWTQGVKKLLPESVSPMFVDDEIVQAIHSLEQEDGVIRQQPLQKNDQVRIARGPLKDLLGVFDHWSSDQGRIKVLLNFINYQASVELHHSLVEKVA
jgi:transcriptional antiterminator RfaH